MKASVCAFLFLGAAAIGCSHAPTANEPSAAETTILMEALREPSSASQGLRLSCQGSNENEGAVAQIVFLGAEKNYAIQGNLFHEGKPYATFSCIGRKDAGYVHRSPNPHFDRYTVNRNRDCEFDDAFVSSKIVEERRGSFSLLSNCARNPDACATVFYCR